MVRMETLGFLLSVAALTNLKLIHLNVKMAFLHDDLSKEIYMEQPQGFVSPDYEYLVRRLQKRLYGLKQAPRQWYIEFDDFV